MRYLKLLLILLLVMISGCSNQSLFITFNDDSKHPSSVEPVPSVVDPEPYPSSESTTPIADPIPGSTGAYVSDLFMQNGQGYFVQSNGKQSHICDTFGNVVSDVTFLSSNSRRQDHLTLLGSPESRWQLQDHNTNQIQDLPLETVGMQLYSFGQYGLWFYSQERQTVTVYYYDYTTMSGQTICHEPTAWVPMVTQAPSPNQVWLLADQDGRPVLRNYTPSGTEDIPLEGLSESPEDHNFSLAWAGERLLLATLPHGGGKIQLWMLADDHWELLASQGVSCIPTADHYVRLAADPAGWIYSRVGGTSVVSGSFNAEDALCIYYLE